MAIPCLQHAVFLFLFFCPLCFLMENFKMSVLDQPSLRRLSNLKSVHLCDGSFLNEFCRAVLRCGSDHGWCPKGGMPPPPIMFRLVLKMKVTQSQQAKTVFPAVRFRPTPRNSGHTSISKDVVSLTLVRPLYESFPRVLKLGTRTRHGNAFCSLRISRLTWEMHVHDGGSSFVRRVSKRCGSSSCYNKSTLEISSYMYSKGMKACGALRDAVGIWNDVQQTTVWQNLHWLSNCALLRSTDCTSNWGTSTQTAGCACSDTNELS